MYTTDVTRTGWLDAETLVRKSITELCLEMQLNTDLHEFELGWACQMKGKEYAASTDLGSYDCVLAFVHSLGKGSKTRVT